MSTSSNIVVPSVSASPHTGTVLVSMQESERHKFNNATTNVAITKVKKNETITFCEKYPLGSLFINNHGENTLGLLNIGYSLNGGQWFPF